MRIRKSHQLKSSLAITTNVGCKNMCSYCPQKTFIQAYKKRSDIKQMSFDTFTKLIASVPKDICLSFSGFSEPWLNPECTSMLIHAFEQGFNIRVNTTLIGITEKDIHQLKQVPFVKFVVHLPDNKNLTRMDVDDNYLNIIKLLIENPLQNLTWKFHKTDSEIDLHAKVVEIVKTYKVPLMYVGLNNRAGKVSVDSNYLTPNKGKTLRHCQDFNHNILLPNGDVCLCHMDWSLKHILGNLLTQNYNDFHKGEVLQKICEGLTNPDADILCRECEKDIVKRTKLQEISYWARNKVAGRKDIY